MLANILEAEELHSLYRKRNKAVETKSVHPKLTDEALAEGWTLLKKNVTSVRLQRNKPTSSHFEDRIW